MARQRGTVNWFDDHKGYGFITRGEGAPDVFVHYSAVKAEGRKTLVAGELVEFEVVPGAKGIAAHDVVKLS